MSYIDAYLIPIAPEKLDAYRRFSGEVAQVYREYGALRIVDCMLDSSVANDAGFHADGARTALEDGAIQRDFPVAAGVCTGETVILSWTEWPSKEARDAGLTRALADSRIQPKEGEETLFEGRRLIAGGFHLLMET